MTPPAYNTKALSVVTEIVGTSMVEPNPWHRAIGHKPGSPEVVCSVGFGVSPLTDRIYVDGLHVQEALRRQGYASTLLVAVVQMASPPGKPLAVTPLHELSSSREFWQRLRTGRVSGLVVTEDLCAGELAHERRRWARACGAARGAVKVESGNA